MAASIAIVVAGFGAAGLLAATSASAHDELLSTGPANGAKVAKLPESVTLTFGEPPLELGARLRIVGPAGDVTLGAPKLSGAKVTQAIEASAGPGKYTVQWKVTSGDGHPISGQFSFTAAAGGPAAATTAPQPPTTEAQPSPTPAASSETTSPDAIALSSDSDGGGSAESSSTPWPWIAGGAALAVAVAGGVVATRRRTN